jgi:hypothetical protein
MITALSAGPTSFIDRRTGNSTSSHFDNSERRQFANAHDELSPEAAELARTIDEYKMLHRRRFITFEEMLSVIKSLGYVRSDG